ncbi:MAG TPA: hypothetical protein VK960_06875 [Acidimicrobiia bacterium]|nr:hypothetical protein [Acidimicrobiia bacterium]
MPEQTPIERIADWVGDEADLSLDEQGRILVGGEMRIDVDVDDERLLLTHTSAEPGAGDDRVAELRTRLPGRATTMTGTVESGATGATVTITNHVYLDGLNHQTFSTAIRDLIGAVDTVGVTVAELEPAETAEPEPAQDPQPEPTPEPMAVAAPEAPHAPEPTREMAAAWVATHVVPSGGMSAWSEPNPELEPAADLEARVQLSIAERRGDWAKVVGSNGWTGWVDARRLVTLGTAPSGPSTSAGLKFSAANANPIILVGALLIGLSALLPWLDTGVDNFSAMDLSASILFDYEGTGSPYIGWILFGIGALTLAVGFLNRPTGPAIVVGIAGIVIPALFAAQIYRLVTDFGGSFSDLTDVLGFGPSATLIGGIVTLVGGNR